MIHAYARNIENKVKDGAPVSDILESNVIPGNKKNSGVSFVQWTKTLTLKSNCREFDGARKTNNASQRDRKGAYHTGQISCLGISRDDVIEKYETDKRQEFHQVDSDEEDSKSTEEKTLSQKKESVSK